MYSSRAEVLMIQLLKTPDLPVHQGRRRGIHWGLLLDHTALNEAKFFRTIAEAMEKALALMEKAPEKV